MLGSDMETEDGLEISGTPRNLIIRRGFTFKIDLKAARHRMVEIGHIKTVFAVSVVACFLSILLSAILWTQMFGRELEFAPIFISFVVPALLFPIAVWFLVGVTLNLHHLEHKMRRLASYDMLTDIMTRRAFFSSCERLYALMKRDKKPFALAYIDLDDFKSINDNYGHTAGDAVLQKFSDILRSSVRQSDIAGRIGGEEFALALPETEMTGAMHIMNQVRVLAKNSYIELGDATINFTISIGLSYCDQTCCLTLEEMIRQADRALYAAKDAGKDHLLQYDSEMENQQAL